MARGGRRGGGRGRGGGGANTQAHGSTNNHRVAKPAVKTLPTALQLRISEEGVPEALLEGLTEFRAAQPFFSSMERLQPEVATPGRYKTCWLGIPGATVKRLDRQDEDSFQATLVLSDDQEQPVFVKRTHILDPILAIEGETVWPRDGALPAPSELLITAIEKANDPMNEAYVDAVFAMIADRMVASDMSPHWCRCFGTFPARVEKYQYNITDEYSSLRRKTFWTRHQRLGIFDVVREEGSEYEEDAANPQQPIAAFSEDQEMDVGDFEEVLDIPTSSSDTVVEIPSGDDADIEVEDAPFEIARPSVQIRKIKGGSEDESDDEEEEEDSESDDFDEIFAEFTDFPVQVSLLERAEGTLEDLLDEELEGAEKEEKWRAWMFQVIAGLAAAQHWFGFVHNDLHTNNVMWSRTEKTHISYKVHGRGNTTTVYRVPTFGYIMKIIDFGRASYTLPEPAGFFISDAFFPGNDAGHQYNCEPFFDSRNGKKVEPNPSFDLARLAVSMLDSLWPERPPTATPIKIMSREGPKTYAETTSALYNLMWEWLTDDAGKNILREPTGKERYPDFDLYSAIAADVHRAVPSQQLEKPLFAAFRVSAAVAETAVAESLYELWTH
jgi:hypothetical protein